MSDIRNILNEEELLRELARHISGELKMLPSEHGIGFALIIYEFNTPGISNYISNGTRDNMIKTLRETADRLEKRQVILAVKEPIQ